MKRYWILFFSLSVAIGVAWYSKQTRLNETQMTRTWKTYEKVANNTISSHHTTISEFAAAKITTNYRGVAQEKVTEDEKKRLKANYHTKDDRILVGDLKSSQINEDNPDLEMINKINPDWKEILGQDLLRFHEANTKVIIKEEIPVIKVQNGKGQYLEQVLITYLSKNGNYSSYHALVDSETGFVTETWDRTVYEKIPGSGAGLGLPRENNSGITGR